jgi:NhaC family Na+:H+ antiporter
VHFSEEIEVTATPTHRQASLPLSLLPLIIMALLLGIGYGLYHIRADSLLVIAALISGLIARGLGYSWKEMEKGISDSIHKAIPAMLIVICVGMLISAWIAAGTIPMLVWFGLKVISPSYFLLTSCLVCSLVSLLTGTSWGTVGTMGIAFIGIAQGLAIPLPAAAGAIIAGSYFGDKISPLSDSTNLAAIASRVNLYDHIAHLQWTTLPAYLIGLIVYTLAGLMYHSGSLQPEQLNAILDVLHERFAFNLLLLLPPAIILFFAIRKLPVIPGMLLSVLTASFLAVFFQGQTLAGVIGLLSTGYKAETGLAAIDTLLSRGGMMSMMDVTLIAFCAFAFAGIVQTAGMLDVILQALLRVARTTGRLIASVVASSAAVALMTGSSFLSVIIPGQLFAPAFKERRLAAKNLSRTTEDSGTVVVPLIPWSMAGVYMSGTLGVPVLSYAPWAVMCWLGMVIALFYGFTGLAIAPQKHDDETMPGS